MPWPPSRHRLTLIARARGCIEYAPDQHDKSGFLFLAPVRDGKKTIGRRLSIKKAKPVRYWCDTLLLSKAEAHQAVFFYGACLLGDASPPPHHFASLSSSSHAQSPMYPSTLCRPAMDGLLMVQVRPGRQAAVVVQRRVRHR